MATFTTVTIGVLVLAVLTSADIWPWGSGSGSSDSTNAPPTTAAYVPVGSLPLTAAQTTSCQCQGKFTKMMQVCSTANITYATACQLHFAMRMNQRLGMRFNKPCSSPINYAALAARAGGCGTGMVIPLKTTRKLRMKVNYSPIKKFCLNDNTEADRSTIYCRLAANSSLGIRCMGACSECSTFNCPSRLLQPIPMHADNA
ncbi:hypothetical protein RvY_19282-1 [Ramazzottius varieornatus]|uniref:Kazal-like domain-containing protein n=1 Tax=Ramazzottius varieornatus TaxID=947166 RepID=A0A1D1W8W4_RAMVA|nr:hypothetical protein RvY_19282-1 [Ramazzottius varieornatus]